MKKLPKKTATNNSKGKTKIKAASNPLKLKTIHPSPDGRPGPKFHPNAKGSLVRPKGVMSPVRQLLQASPTSPFGRQQLYNGWDVLGAVENCFKKHKFQVQGIKVSRYIVQVLYLLCFGGISGMFLAPLAYERDRHAPQRFVVRWPQRVAEEERAVEIAHKYLSLLEI